MRIVDQRLSINLNMMNTPPPRMTMPRMTYNELEIELFNLLPRIDNTQPLEEIAYVLGVDIPEETRGNARTIARRIRAFVDSSVFDNLPNSQELLTRVVRMLNQFIANVNEQMENARGAEGGGDEEEERVVSADDGQGLLIAVTSMPSTIPRVSLPPFLPRAQLPSPRFEDSLMGPSPRTTRPATDTGLPRMPRLNRPFSYGGLGFGMGGNVRTQNPTPVTNTYQLNAPQVSNFGLNMTTVPRSAGHNPTSVSAANLQTPRSQSLHPNNPFSPYHPSNRGGHAFGYNPGGILAPHNLGGFPPYGYSVPNAPMFASTPAVPNLLPNLGSSAVYGNAMSGAAYANPLAGQNTSTVSAYNPLAAPLAAPIAAPPAAHAPQPVSTTANASAAVSGGSPVATRKAFWRTRDLKLNGQIGQPGEAGKLAYSSLSYQIHSAQVRGFEEAEICNAVINAITPNLSLRTHLERQRGLTLTRLVNRLRTHFLLKDAATAFTDMGNMVQKVGETEINFVMNVMGMRDDVLALSAEEGGQYTEKLVQQKMLHVLSVGLRKANVRLAMRSVLKSPDISDDDIFDALKEIVLNEAEHLAKADGQSTLTTTTTTGKSRASTLATAASTLAACSELSLDKTDMLIGEVQQLSRTVNQLSTLPSEFQKLKKEFTHQKQSNQQNSTSNGSVQSVAATDDGLVFVGQGYAVGSGATRGLGAAPPNGVGRGKSGFGTTNGGGSDSTNAGAGRGGKSGNTGRDSNLISRVGKQITTTIRKCEKCGQAGPGIWWDHCFICCGQGHQMSECPTAKNVEG